MTDSPILGPGKLLQPSRRRRGEGRPTADVVVAEKQAARSHIRAERDVDIEIAACWKIRSKPIGWAAPGIAADDSCQGLLPPAKPKPEQRNGIRREGGKDRLSRRHTGPSGLSSQPQFDPVPALQTSAEERSHFSVGSSFQRTASGVGNGHSSLSRAVPPVSST
jgi:hypothetical protein